MDATLELLKSNAKELSQNNTVIKMSGQGKWKLKICMNKYYYINRSVLINSVSSEKVKNIRCKDYFFIKNMEG